MEPYKTHQRSIKKYHRYKNIFKVKDCKILAYFEELLNEIPCSLECSNKKKNRTIFSKRLNLWCLKVRADIFKNIDTFFQQIRLVENVNINFSLFEKLFHDIAIDKIKQVITGIDLRAERKVSRLKYWLIIQDSSQKIDEILSIHGYNDSVLELMDSSDGLLFGIDFYLNGDSRLKIYPMFEEHQINNPYCQSKFRNLFGKQTLELIACCKRIQISFKDPCFKKIIHFHLMNPDEFILRLNHPLIFQINEKYKIYGYPLRVISLSDEELEQNKIEEVNLYY